MTPNKSLETTSRIQDLMHQDILQYFTPLFPMDVVNEYTKDMAGKKKVRKRAFTRENTLLTMFITAMHPDKSLQNSVNIFQEVFRKNNAIALEKEQERLDALCVESHEHKILRRVGRPCKLTPQTLKNKTISSNTAAYCKARIRLELPLIEKVFKSTTSFPDTNCIRLWHGRTVYNTDGTYFQMQDMPGIPEKYRTQKSATGELMGYPQGLLQVLTQHGSGAISAYKIAGRSDSELVTGVEMVNQLPQNSLLLADDLYNCFAFMAHVIESGIDIIVPDKKKRLCTTIRSIGKDDDIVEIARPKGVKPLFEGQVLPDKITIRRITYPDTVDPNIKHTMQTSIISEQISALEIVQKYSSRWDIEITIREIKTLMDMHIARSQTEEMVFKEMGVALSAYNTLRRILAMSVDKTDFSPQSCLFQKLFTHNKVTLVDRKGRVYARCSSGRPVIDNKENLSS